MEKHRILVVGVGSIGERHLRCFQNTGRADVRFCELNPALARTVAERYGIGRTYGEVGEAMSDASWRPRAAVIATPAPAHLPIARQLAEAGMHLLIEKPLSTATDGAEELQAIIRRRGLVAMVAYVLRVHPAVQEARQVLLEGRFGRPVQVAAVSGQHFPTYRPAYRTIYYRDRSAGGGAVQDALTHAINAVEFLVGPADRVMADAAHRVLEGVDVEDVVHVLARHSEILACYSLNQFQAPFENTISVVCERGTVRIEFHENRWRWMTEPGGTWHDHPVEARERDALFTRQADVFLDCIEGRAQPPCPLPDGLQTLRVNLAILAAADKPGWRSVQDH